MPTHPQGFLASVQQAKSRIVETNVEITHQLMQQKKSPQDPPLLIDVREDLEWANGHLPGAIHIGKGVLERDIEKYAPDRETPLILYCGGGFRSALAADALQNMGYQAVQSMDGGFRSWVDAGYLVVVD